MESRTEPKTKKIYKIYEIIIVISEKIIFFKLKISYRLASPGLASWLLGWAGGGVAGMLGSFILYINILLYL